MLMALAACGPRNASAPAGHDEANSVYFWKTVFHPDDSELEFIEKHDVRRIYLRMFDVTADRYARDPDFRAIPNASVRFDGFDLGQLADKEFVPVVYVTLDALRAMEGSEATLAANIVRRVRNMCSFNGVPDVGELQLDCDWTLSTEESFFSLCRSVRRSLADLGLDWRLSSTIRLHQLARKAPPVDCGVLMVYNTGSFDDPSASNSIISLDDVEPYLRHLPSYPLHLDIAYPTYSWQLLFNRRGFVGLLKGVEVTDTTRFASSGSNSYTALADVDFNGRTICRGDIIRNETSDFKTIDSIKSMIEEKLPCGPHSNILYHLDSDNLSNYTDDEIARLFSTAR